MKTKTQRMIEAANYTVTDALYEQVLDNLLALSVALRERGMVMEPKKADQVIEILNKCLEGTL